MPTANFTPLKQDTQLTDTEIYLAGLSAISNYCLMNSDQNFTPQQLAEQFYANLCVLIHVLQGKKKVSMI